MRWAVVLVLALGAAACVPPAPPPVDRAACEQGVAAAVQRSSAWGNTTPVECRPSEQFAGAGVYLGFTTGEDRALAFYGTRTFQAGYYTHVATHELGHAYDVKHLTDAQRARFAEVVGIPAWDREVYADVFMMIRDDQVQGLYGTFRPFPWQVLTICTEGLVPC